MQQTLPWILASIAMALLAGVGLKLLLNRRKPRAKSLPSDWTLTARPVFSSEERRVYRHLREALPHHVVLSKLPLVRFCQPAEPAEVRFWFDLIGAIHVTFAICSANGRVLAAIDLDTDRSSSRRAQQIKQSVLGACRVRYVRCPADRVPSISELQLLVPQSTPTARGQRPAPAKSRAHDHLSSSMASQRRERTTLWQDSGLFQDSFFGAEARHEGANSDFGAAPLRGMSGSPGRDLPPDDIGGIVVDGPSPVRH
jgi:hypothetical protein